MSTRRRTFAIGLLVVLLFLSGCMGFGSATSEERLLESATYDWDTETDVRIDLGESEYRSVYSMENRSTMRIYQATRYGTEHPVQIRSLQFRYDNGTVVNASAIGVEESRSAVYLDLPAEDGQVAFTAPKRSKSFSTQVFVEGSYEITVPPGHRVDNIVLGTVRPGGYDTELVGDRVHITWEDVTSRSIRVEYYLERDLYLFAGLVVTAAIAGAIGIGYVYRQVQALRRRREEMGLDLDLDDDDDGRRPPPGMQ